VDLVFLEFERTSVVLDFASLVSEYFALLCSALVPLLWGRQDCFGEVLGLIAFVVLIFLVPDPPDYFGFSPFFLLLFAAVALATFVIFFVTSFVVDLDAAFTSVLVPSRGVCFVALIAFLEAVG
jgi:uncharacterized membrane protein